MSMSKFALLTGTLFVLAACQTPGPQAEKPVTGKSQPTPELTAVDTASLSQTEAATTVPVQAETPVIQPCDPIHISDNNATLAPFEVRRIQTAIEACWRPLKGVPFDQNLKVILGVNLDIDGHLIGNPDIIQAPDPVAAGEFSEASLARAKQALDSCLPFDLPKEKYVAWCRMELAFDPKKLN